MQHSQIFSEWKNIFAYFKDVIRHYKFSIYWSFPWQTLEVYLHLSDTFVQSDLQSIQVIHNLFYFLWVCVPWELNPWPLLYHSATGHKYYYTFFVVVAITCKCGNVIYNIIYLFLLKGRFFFFSFGMFLLAAFSMQWIWMMVATF